MSKSEHVDDHRELLEEVARKYSVDLPVIINLYGRIEEDTSVDPVEELYTLIEVFSQVKEKADIIKRIKEDVPEDEQTKEDEIAIEFLEDMQEPKIHLIISTHGGEADEMFSIYDCIETLKKYCEVTTIGLGKVMSAGVLWLASGTKGCRKIGKHCRVMLHPVGAGHVGSVKNIKNELQQTMQVEQAYATELEKHTNFTKKELKKILNNPIHTYLTAEQAIEKGLVDQIL